MFRENDTLCSVAQSRNEHRRSASTTSKIEKKGDVLLLHWNGRFGNRMFTYAFLRQYAEQLNLNILLPSEWEGTTLFKNRDYKIIEDDELRLYLNQTAKPFDNLDARLSAIQKYSERTGASYTYMNPDNPVEYGSPDVCIDSLCCYHPSIFKRYSKSRMLDHYFDFTDEVKNSDLYKRMEDRQGTYVAAHLRRDDIADPKNYSNTGYSVISKASYVAAFKKYGYDPDQIEWVTDDTTGKYGIRPVSNQGGWSYPEGSERLPDLFYSWFPDFLKLMFAKTVFRANSSFSWWAAFFNKGTVYAPRLHKRELYHESFRAIDVSFEEGNHPHWLCVRGQDLCEDIIIN